MPATANEAMPPKNWLMKLMPATQDTSSSVNVTVLFPDNNLGIAAWGHATRIPGETAFKHATKDDYYFNFIIIIIVTIINIVSRIIL